LLYLMHATLATIGEDQRPGLRPGRQELVGTGGVTGTGEFHDCDIDAVYRAVGYAGTKLPHLPFDERKRVIPNHEGRVDDADSQDRAAEADVVQGIYATGWIKRGPVGLIGNTKGDALETIGHILDDRAAGVHSEPIHPVESAIG